MRKTISIFLMACCVLFSRIAFSQENNSADLSLEEIMNRNLVDMSIEDWVDLDNQELNKLSFYGFLNFNTEKVFNEPTLDEEGNTIYESGTMEMSTPNFHIYGGSRLSEKFTVFFNLGKSGNNLSIVNAWGNWKITDLFQIRVGKQYRRFGLFNERLDQVPTYLGIEPPELFDKDHLLLPRTSLISIHGEKNINRNNVIKYLVTTSNGESGPESKVLPLGWDLRYRSSFFMVGMSGYTSNIGSRGSQSTVSLGSGSPSAGILPWMDEDKYTVFGVFAETRKGNFGIKAAYFTANHKATRNAASIMTLVENDLLNASQISRKVNSGADLTALTEADINTDGDYTVNTWYIRVSYELNTVIGKITPYVFLDSYENLETIASKSFGGDNEAGASDNGEFIKPSLGIVYRPIEKVAIKLDGSFHNYDFNGASESYPEIRLDFSYMFR